MIRRMRKEDLSSVKLLMQSIPGLWHEAWNDEMLQQAFSVSADLALVCEMEGQVVALVFCYDLGFRAYLGEFAVSEEMRGRGLGMELLKHIEHVLRKRGCELIISDVWKSTEPFYRKLGWREPQATLLRKRLIGR